MEHVGGSNQLADLLTKPLNRPRFSLLLKKCGVGAQFKGDVEDEI